MNRSKYIGISALLHIFFFLFIYQFVEDPIAKGSLGLAILVGLISTTWYRLKDCGWPRTLAFLYILPFLGVILTIILFFIPSKTYAATQNYSPSLPQLQNIKPTASTRKIYFYLNNVVQGPFTFDQAQSLLQNKTVLLETLACNEGSEDWRPLYELINK